MELGEVYVKIGADIVPLEKALGKARNVTKKTTEQMRAQMKTLGTGMVIAGAAITAAFALTVKSAIGFQKQLAQVSTMLDESAMEIMPQYKKGLLDMSMAFGESTDTLSRGLYDILSASIPPAQALEVLGVAAKAATAGVTDTGVAADAITTILNSYGMQAEDAGKISDILFATVKRGKLTFDELAPAIGKSAALAATAGLSFEDLTAMIATLTRAGIRVDEAMTSVNGILRAFLKPTDDAKEAAKEFGLELSTNTLKTIGMTGVMDKLKDATAEQLAVIFPNIRALKGMAGILGDMEGYGKDYDLMLNSAGLTQIAFAKQSATLGFKIEQLKKSFNVIAVTVGDVLIPVIQSIVERIGKLVFTMKEWMDKHPGLVKAIVLLGAALGVLTMAGGVLILGALYFTKLSTTMTGMSTTAKLAIPSLGKLKIALNSLGGAALLAGANIIIWLEVWKEWQKVADSTHTSIQDGYDALMTFSNAQLYAAEKMGITVQEFVKMQKEGKTVTEMMDTLANRFPGYTDALDVWTMAAVEQQVSAKLIVTTVEDLAQEMSLLTKEYGASSQAISENITYYTSMIDLLNKTDVILQAELTLLEKGTEEWYKKKEEIADNTKAINELNKELTKLTEPLEGLDLITAKMALLGDSIEEIPAKLGLLQEKAVLLKTALDEAVPDTEAWWEAKTAYEENKTAIDALVGSFDEYGEKGKELLKRLIELTDKQKELQEAIDVVGVDKASEAYRFLKVEYNATESAIASLIIEINNLEREQKEAEEAARSLADAYKTITDKIYELTHTPMENAIYKLDEQKQAYIALGVEIGIVNEWYDLQIAKLHELNPELDTTADKLKEVGEAGAKAGEEIADSFTKVIGTIDLSTQALSNFTKEGVAAAIAAIKMKFLPLIRQAVKDLNWARAHFSRFWGYQQTALDNLVNAMDSAIDNVMLGYGVYQDVLESLGGSTQQATNSMVNSWGNVSDAIADTAESISNAGTFQAGTSTAGWGTSSYQTGTPFVPKTGMAMLHRGEAVIPANQNTYNNTQNNTINIPSQGGNVQLIAKAVEKVLYETGRQFKRRGFEIIPGRG